MYTLRKAKIFDPDKPSDGFYVQFNPNSLSYSVGTNKKSSKNVSEPDDLTQSQPQGDPTGRTSGSALTVKLFYHTYVSETSYTDVRLDINRIRAFLRRTEDNGRVASRRVAFAWGTLTHVGTLESLGVSYQMFAADGTPVQAEATLTIYGDDPDVTASAKDRQDQLDYQRDANVEWRLTGQPPDEVKWLFFQEA